MGITHLTVWNGAHQLVTRIRFYDLRKGRLVPRLYRLPELGDALSERAPCLGIEFTWQARPGHAREWVDLSLPQGCLGQDSGTVRVKAGTSLRGHPSRGNVSPELGSREYACQVFPQG